MTATITKTRRIERAIIRRIVLDAVKAGYTLGVWDGEELVLKGATTAKAVLDKMFSVDEEYLFVYKDGKRIGWVLFVYGNGGWDVVTDYSPRLAEIMIRAVELAGKYSA